MKLSQGFWQTTKEEPSDAQITSHKLLIRAGLIAKTAAGIYSYLPFAVRSIRKIENIIREELNKIGSQELLMSIMTPGDLWRETGRWDKMSGEMLRAVDKGGRDLCFSPTNEEAITDIFRKNITSYKQLPVSLYQINTKFRDEIRPRFGLMRGREFSMKDAYTFHADKGCMDSTYENFYQAYSNIFSRMGLEYIIVEADGGAIASAGMKTHEFQVLASAGEDTVVVAKKAQYAANIEKAKTFRHAVEFAPQSECSEVSTPNASTIFDVCQFLEVAEYQSLKSLVYSCITGEEEKFTMVCLLGDDELNELKLKNYLNCDHLKPATDNQIKDLGLIKGFIGPQGNTDKMRVLFDEAISGEHSFVVGANKKDFHLTGLVISRDIANAEFTDLRMAKLGDTIDGEPIEIVKGIEVGHIFQLGDKYSDSMKATVLDHNGKSMAPLMGCYGIGVTRTLQSAIEQNHDENGIIWPMPIAPYQVYLVHIGKSDDFQKLSDEIYEELLTEGIEVLYDDRKAGPGFKLKDADLLGLPLIVTLGERDYQKDNMFELKLRSSGEKMRLGRSELISEIKKQIKEHTNV